MQKYRLNVVKRLLNFTLCSYPIVTFECSCKFLCENLHRSCHNSGEHGINTLLCNSLQITQKANWVQHTQLKRHWKNTILNRLTTTSSTEVVGEIDPRPPSLWDILCCTNSATLTSCKKSLELGSSNNLFPQSAVTSEQRRDNRI